MNLATASLDELREAMAGRCCDPAAVLLGRYAHASTVAGEVDGELALSYVLFPSDAMLEAVARADAVAA